MIVNGQHIAVAIYEELSKRVAILKHRDIIPHLVVILVGDNASSQVYVKQKQKAALAIGAKLTLLQYPETITQKELEEKVQLLNNDPFINGILIQRPLPEQINADALAQQVNPHKDLDGFHPASDFTLPLPLAVVRILEEIHTSLREPRPTGGEAISLTGLPRSARNDELIMWLTMQKIVVIGKGEAGGKPTIAYLRELGLNPTVIDRQTPDPDALTKDADIIITATGKENIINQTNIKPGVILIGVGLDKNNEGKLYGDYVEEKIKDKASFYTPTPGGVGPVNVAMLMDNLVTATETQIAS